MTTLTVRGLSAGYGGHRVLAGLDLDVPDGTTTAVLGPSGCGKTTLLRVLAGFVEPSAGWVELDGRVVAGAVGMPERAVGMPERAVGMPESPGAPPARSVMIPAEKRGIGYVAQEGALFPHLDVSANILFGLPRGQRRGPAARRRVGELLELVSLTPDLARRRPAELSGGQQQRVALARALAREPGLVLLDEPFSALDAGLRAHTRQVVAQALAQAKVSVVLVTHDQDEALSFADRVAIMRGGTIVQVGTPGELYRHPVDRQTAAFLGEAVFLPGTLIGGGAVSCALGTVPVADAVAATTPEAAATPGVEVLLRPEQIRIQPVDVATAHAVVLSVSYFGHDALIRARLAADQQEIMIRTFGDEAPAVGERVGLAVAGQARALPAA